MELRLAGVGVAIDRVQIVTDLTIECPPGTFVGLLGPNGSGKSTALKTIYRAVRPSTGAVLLDGADLVRDLTPTQTARRVAALAQEHSDGVDFTVLDVVTTGRTPHQGAWSPTSAADREIIFAVLDTVGMTEHAGRAFAALSGGERQRVLLARALVQEPSVLILDEPTNHLDISTQLNLLELVRSLGITVLAALHDLNLAAAFCDRLYVLRDGVVVGSGTPEQVLTTELIGAVFGVRAYRGTHPLTGRLHLAFSSLPGACGAEVSGADSTATTMEGIEMTTAGASRAASALLLASALGLGACGYGATAGPDSAGSPSATAPGGRGYPVEVSNCGRTLRFDQAPQRIVSGWTTNTELLIELGLADRIVGQYNTSSGTPVAKYAAIEKTIPVLSESAPTREALLAARPDLIWADGGYLFDGQQLPSIEDLDAGGVQVMILSGFCTDDASKATVGDVATDLATLGTIFGIRGEADRVQADIDDRLGQIASRLAGRDPVPVAVISSFQGAVYAYDGVYSDIARLAGATNSYAGTLPAGRYYSEISVEDLTRRNPATIVYLLGGSESEATAGEYLRSRFPTVAAVRDNRVIYLPQTDSTNLAGVDGVQKLAAALHP